MRRKIASIIFVCAAMVFVPYGVLGAEKTITLSCKPLSSTELMQVRIATKKLATITSTHEWVQKMKSDIAKKLALQKCGTAWMSFIEPTVTSYASVKKDLTKLSVLAVSKTDQNKQKPIVDMSGPLGLLSNHVEQYFGMLSPSTTYVMQNTNGSIDFTAKESDIGTMQWKITWKWEWKIDLVKWYFDLTMDGSMVMSVQNPFIKDPAKISAKWNISMINNGSTYIKFNTLSLDMSLPSVVEQQLQDSPIKELQDMINTIPSRTKDTYIALWKSASSSTTSSPLTFFPKNRGKFTYIEWNVTYGMPSLQWCKMIADETFSTAKCEKWMKNVDAWTQWKWILYIKNNNGTYAMWFTKKFLWKNVVNHIPASWYEKDIIVWTKDKIVSVHMPLDTTWKWSLVFEKDTLKIQQATPTWTFSLAWPVTPTASILTLTSTDKTTKTDINATMSLKRSNDATSSSRRWEWSVIVTKNKSKVVDATFNLSIQQSETKTFIPSTPKKTMTMEQFQKLLDTTLFTK
jgi:hypothetical protein